MLVRPRSVGIAGAAPTGRVRGYVYAYRSTQVQSICAKLGQAAGPAALQAAFSRSVAGPAETDVWALGVLVLNLFEPRRLRRASAPPPPPAPPKNDDESESDDDDLDEAFDAPPAGAPVEILRAFALFDVAGEAGGAALDAYATKKRNGRDMTASKTALWLAGAAKRAGQLAPERAATTKKAAEILVDLEVMDVDGAALLRAAGDPDRMAAALGLDAGLGLAAPAAAPAPAPAPSPSKWERLRRDARHEKKNDLGDVATAALRAAKTKSRQNAGAAALACRLVDEHFERYPMPEAARKAVAACLKPDAGARPRDGAAAAPGFRAALVEAAKAAGAPEPVGHAPKTPPNPEDRGRLCAEVALALARAGAADWARPFADEAVALSEGGEFAKKHGARAARGKTDLLTEAEGRRLDVEATAQTARAVVAASNGDGFAAVAAYAKVAKLRQKRYCSNGHPLVASALCALAAAKHAFFRGAHETQLAHEEALGALVCARVRFLGVGSRSRADAPADDPRRESVEGSAAAPRRMPPAVGPRPIPREISTRQPRRRRDRPPRNIHAAAAASP